MASWTGNASNDELSLLARGVRSWRSLVLPFFSYFLSYVFSYFLILLFLLLFPLLFYLFLAFLLLFSFHCENGAAPRSENPQAQSSEVLAKELSLLARGVSACSSLPTDAL